eukprot:TRINITY_DN12353_c0_g2_i1.p1 TRINITY_DN12353_c0_g2~~TRINITY_DN12353_c0_g2_i1.p1  ORF type:complete len:1195 (+),score=507.11 TRINITY_DN12353_c0_g2_i1:176-3586(+)
MAVRGGEDLPIKKEIAQRGGESCAEMNDAELADYLGWVTQEMGKPCSDEDEEALFETGETAVASILQHLRAGKNDVLECVFAHYLNGLKERATGGIATARSIRSTRVLIKDMLTITTRPVNSDDGALHFDLQCGTTQINDALSAGVMSLHTSPAADEEELCELASSLHELCTDRLLLTPLVASALCAAAQHLAKSPQSFPKASGAIADALRAVLDNPDNRDYLEDNLVEIDRALRCSQPAEPQAQAKKSRPLEETQDDGDADGSSSEEAAPPAKRRRSEEGQDAEAPSPVPADQQRMAQGTVDLGLPGGRLLQRSDLENIIIESLLDIDHVIFEGFEEMHRRGMEANMSAAARKLQLEEIQKANADADKKDVFKVERGAKTDFTKLLVDLGAKDTALKHSRDQLYQDSQRKENPVVVSAFNCISDAFGTLKREGRHSMLHGAALISRLVASQDSAPEHMLLNRILYSCVKRVAGRDLDTTLAFALQLLYTYYGTLAPFGMVEDSRIHHNDFETVTETPDCSIDIKKPLVWLTTDTAGVSAQDTAAVEADKPSQAEGAAAAHDFAFSDKEGTYGYVFERVLDSIGQHLVHEVSGPTSAFAERGGGKGPQQLALSVLLGECPAIPKKVWGILHEQFCTSGDTYKTWAAMQAFCDLVKHRPAAKNRALSYFLYYGVSGHEQARSCAINFIMCDILPHDIRIKETVVGFIAECLKQIGATDNSAPEADVEVRLQNTMPLYLAVTLIQPGLLDHAFTLFDEGKAGGKTRLLRTILSDPNLPRVVRKLGVAKVAPILAKHSKSLLSLHLARLVVHNLREELDATLKEDDSKDKEALPSVARGVVPTGDAVMDSLRAEFPPVPQSPTSNPVVRLIEADLDRAKDMCLRLYVASDDVRFLILLLSITSRASLQHRVLPMLLASCRPEHVSVALREVVAVIPSHHAAGLGMAPTDLLRYFHGLIPAEGGGVTVVGGVPDVPVPGSPFGEATSKVALRHVIVAIDACIADHTTSFSDKEMRTALTRLVSEPTVSPYFMRTVLQTLCAHPHLLSFVIASIIPTLLKKNIWAEKDQVLWKGFVKLVMDHQPKTLDVLFSLPENVLIETLSGRTRLLRCFVKHLQQNKMVHSKLLTTLEANFAGISAVY